MKHTDDNLLYSDIHTNIHMDGRKKRRRRSSKSSKREIAPLISVGSLFKWPTETQNNINTNKSRLPQMHNEQDCTKTLKVHSDMLPITINEDTLQIVLRRLIDRYGD
jgi:hypothetical protein